MNYLVTAMFSSASNAIEHNAYDLNSEENVGKWRGLLVTSLQKVRLGID